MRRVLGSFWFHLIAATIVFGLLLSFVAKPYLVPSGSMEPALQPGDRILVNRLAYVAAEPASGDIVVFDADERWDGVVTRDENVLRAGARWIGEATGFGPSSPHTLVKRIIGTPGHTVVCCSVDGDVVVDGVTLDEPYVVNDLPFIDGTLDCATVPRSMRCFAEVTVPDDSYLMLGDNRSGSSDSAVHCRGASEADDSCWRWATRSGIVGAAAAIWWPVGRWSGL